MSLCWKFSKHNMLPSGSGKFKQSDYGKESSSTPCIPAYQQANTTSGLYSSGKSGKQEVASRQSSIHMTSGPNNFTMTANASVCGLNSMSRASSSYQNTLQRTAENNIIYESSGKVKQVSQNSTQ